MPKIDEMGVTRHAWSRERLERLYNELCEYSADCEQQEFDELFNAFVQIKTALHQRMLNK